MCIVLSGNIDGVLVISFGETLSLGVGLFAYGVPTAVKITFLKQLTKW